MEVFTFIYSSKLNLAIKVVLPLAPSVTVWVLKASVHSLNYYQ